MKVGQILILVRPTDGIRRFKVKLGSGKQGYCIACIVWIMASICGIKAVTIA